jgi:acetate kinase
MRPDNPSILTINRGSSSIKLAEYQLGEPLKRSTAGVISTDGSRVTLHVIRTDEDLMIARSVCGIRQADAGNGKNRP